MDFDAEGLLRFLDDYNHVPVNGLYIFSTECVEDSQWVVVTTNLPELEPKPAGKGKGTKGPPLPPKGGGKGPPLLAKGKKGNGEGPSGKPPFGRKLQWKSIGQDALKNSIFEEIEAESRKDPLDVGCMNSLFRPKSPTGKGVGKATAKVSAASGKGQSAKGVSKSQVMIFDPKKGQNISIIMRTCGTMSQLEERCNAIMRLDGKDLPVELLEHILNNLLPNLEGDLREELLAYSTDMSALRDVEKQCVMLLRIPRLEQRIHIMMFAASMDEVANDLQAIINAYKDASSQVRASLALRRIFKIILHLGNYLNYGITETQFSNGNCVKGFELESLLKLSEFRSSQFSDLTALHCVVVHLLQQVQSERTEKGEASESPSLWIESLKVELSSVEQIGKGNVVKVNELQERINAYFKSVESLQAELNDHAEAYGDEGCEILTQVLNYSQERADTLRDELTELLNMANTLLDFFASTKDTTTCLQSSFGTFFETLWKFFEALEIAWKDVLNNPKKLGKFLPADTYSFREVHSASNAPDKDGLSANSERLQSNPGGERERERFRMRGRPTSDSQAIRRRRPGPRSTEEND